MSDFNLGTVTAYGYAKDKGYTGTEDEYAELMASYADVAEQAAESATQAAASATTASTKASEAAQSATAAASSKTAAQTAQTGAETAAQTATTKAGEASTSATTASNKATEATTAATTATGKATEAAGSATTATTKAGEASTSATNAAASATRAQEILDSIPADYSQLSEDVEDLKDGLNDTNAVVATKFGFHSSVESTMFNRADVYSAAGTLAKTRRWFVNHQFLQGDVINKISFGVAQDSTQRRSVLVEIWENENGTLNKVAGETFDVRPQSIVPETVVTYNYDANYTVENGAYISFLPITNNAIQYIVDPDGADNMLVSTDVDTETTSLALSSLSPFAIKTLPSITINYESVSGVNVVTIGTGMDYEEIQDALIAINDDTATNPYTFWLMPKSTPYKPFSMLRNSFTDNYPWSGIRTRNISIIGMDKAHCVIRSDSGNYKLPCGEPLTNGVIKNVSFVMTNDDQDPNATQGGYCLHIDCKPLNDMGYKMIIEDCDFENSSGPCVGIGVHANCDLQFRNCHFDTTLSANYNPHEGYRNLVDYGVVYAHTSTAATAPDQHLTVVDCVGECAEGSKSLRIDKTTQYDPETSSFVYTLIRNVFWNKTLNAAGYGISGSLTADAKNFGNNNV